MHNQSRDDLEKNQKLRQNNKEESIIALLKLKFSIAELFNSNLDDDKISDIKGIFNRLRNLLPKIIRKEILKKGL